MSSLNKMYGRFVACWSLWDTEVTGTSLFSFPVFLYLSNDPPSANKHIEQRGEVVYDHEYCAQKSSFSTPVSLTIKPIIQINNILFKESRKS